MFKILILAYLIGQDPVDTQKTFILGNNFKTIEECKKEDESVSQNLMMHGYKTYVSCKISKTIFPVWWKNIIKIKSNWKAKINSPAKKYKI